MRRLIAAVCFVLVLAGVSPAQDASQMPKPGPEHKKLQYFVGTWNVEYDIKASPMAPAILVTNSEGKASFGEFKGLSVMGYNAEEKVYTYDGFDSLGHAEHYKGTMQGDSLIWTSESEMAGKTTKWRIIAKQISPTLYTMKLEMGSEGAWTTVMEGKGTKVK